MMARWNIWPAQTSYGIHRVDHMEYRLTSHAERELPQRQIPLDLVASVLDNPQQIVPEREDCKAYQSIVDFEGKAYLLRVIVKDNVDPAIVVTAYRTSRIRKYWRES